MQGPGLTGCLSLLLPALAVKARRRLSASSRLPCLACVGLRALPCLLLCVTPPVTPVPPACPVKEQFQMQGNMQSFCMESGQAKFLQCILKRNGWRALDGG